MSYRATRLSGTGRVALALLLLSGTKCREDRELGQTMSLQSEETFLALGDRCRDTGGTWRPGLLSCICADGFLFDPTEGCRAVIIEPLAIGNSTTHGESGGHLAQGLREPLVTTILRLDDKIPGRLRAAWHERIATAPGTLYRGLTLPPQGTEEIAIVFGILTERAYRVSLGPLDLGFLARPSFVHIGLRPLMEGGLTPNSFADACEAAVLTSTAYAVADGTARHVCHAAAESWLEAIEPSPATAALGFLRDEGQDCSYLCQYAHAATVQGFGRFRAVTMRHFVPYARSVSASGPEGLGVDLYLSPQGEVESVTISLLRDALPRDMSAAAAYASTVFDDRLVPLFTDSEGETTLACVNDMQREIGAAVARGEPGPLCALAMETGIDCRARHLAGAFDSAAVLPHASSPVWGPGPRADSSSDPRSLGLFNGEHGTGVAEVMLKGLEGVRLGLIDPGALEVYGATDTTLAAWSSFIAQQDARVVNISQVFSRTVADCEGFFGRLFAAHPNTLFVAGVGNSGQRHGIHACPSGLWRAHPNLLTVAGTASDGSLHRSSNRGPDIAMVAAPFEVELIALDRPYGPPVHAHGTSYAAPAVANLALRMLGVAPGLAPEEIVGRIIAACRQDGIDVLSGGQIDAERTIAILRGDQ